MGSRYNKHHLPAIISMINAKLSDYCSPSFPPHTISLPVVLLARYIFTLFILNN